MMESSHREGANEREMAAGQEQQQQSRRHQVKPSATMANDNRNNHAAGRWLIVNLARNCFITCCCSPLVRLMLVFAFAILVLAQPQGAAGSVGGVDEDEEISLLSNELPARAADEWPLHKRNHYQHSGSWPRKQRRLSAGSDPFEFTFADYLREARGQSMVVAAADEESSGHAGNNIHQHRDHFVSIVNDDDADQQPAQDAHPEARRTPEKEQQQQQQQVTLVDDDEDQQQSKSNNLNGDQQLELQFAWKSLATSKCSKACGRGRRLLHLSCIDTKFNVRVDDQLCLRAQLPKPSELSDQFCNEIDCPPEWTTVEYQRCNDNETQSSAAAECKLSLFKQLTCVQFDKLGQLIHLEESRCNQTPKWTPAAEDKAPVQQPQVNSQQQQQHFQTTLIPNDYSVDLSGSDGATWSASGHSAELAHSQAGNSIMNEPFYEPGVWSECAGAACGQLGRRHRNLTCRLYLSRSAKFINLADSACQQTALELHREEPCYMDCASMSHEPVEGDQVEVKKQQQQQQAQDVDELVYELDTNRFVWNHSAWTKCSANCLGGQRESLLECWDTKTNSVVESSACDLQTRPRVLRETCNDIPCAPEWRVEPFSECSRSCGSSGFRTRSIVCVQQVPLIEGQSSQMIVSNEMCIGQQQQQQQSDGARSILADIPHRVEPCNRHDCPPEWQLGPWSDCSQRCGRGIRNRTVSCVQEFADRFGPLAAREHNHTSASGHSIGWQLVEAIKQSATSWFPGKSTQIPFHECYELYKTIPSTSESCHEYDELECANERRRKSQPDAAGLYIDADREQNFDMLNAHESGSSRRRTITLKVGGRAQIVEGKNLKIRCRVLQQHQPSNSNQSLVQQHFDFSSTTRNARHPVEWRKDGVRIFANDSTVADKQNLDETDNSILSNDVSIVPSAERLTMMQADEPPAARVRKMSKRQRARTLSVRSWNVNSSQEESSQRASYQFVPQFGAALSLSPPKLESSAGDTFSLQSIRKSRSHELAATRPDSIAAT